MINAALKLADDTKTKPTRRVAFTKDALERVPAGESTIHDHKQKGLVFRVRTGGGKAFYVIKKFKGRVLRHKLGDFPEMSIENARKAAVDAINLMNKDIDPAAERRKERGQLTIGALWETYKVNHLVPRCSPRTLAADLWLYNNHLDGITTRRLSDLAPAAVNAIHAKASKSSKVSANRAVQLLKRLYRYAAMHHGYLGVNPTVAVKMHTERSRERFLTPDEMPRFIAAAEAEGQPWADFFKLCLFVGARRSNVQAMKWADLDMKGATWTIPASESKNGQAMSIPLSGPAIDILKRRRGEQDALKNKRMQASPYVFPAMRDKGETLHLSQPARPFDRICARANITGMTIHDLRRSCGAWLAASGASLPIIGKMLGHADLRATQIYARLDLAPVRVALEGATAAMLKPAEEDEKA